MRRWPSILLCRNDDRLIWTRNCLSGAKLWYTWTYTYYVNTPDDDCELWHDYDMTVLCEWWIPKLFCKWWGNWTKIPFPLFHRCTLTNTEICWKMNQQTGKSVYALSNFEPFWEKKGTCTMFSFSFTLTFGTLLHAHCTHHRCAKKRKLVKVPAVPSNFDTGKSLFPSPLTCGAQLNRITEFTRNLGSYEGFLLK